MENDQGNEVKQLIIKFYMEDPKDRSCYNKLKKQKNMSAYIKTQILSSSEVERDSVEEMEQRLEGKIDWTVSKVIQELLKANEEDDWENIKM